MSLRDAILGRGEWTWESHLVNRLGLHRDELRGLRERLLTEGVDWRLEKNRVEVSVAGVEKLVAHLKVPSAAQATPGEALPSAPQLEPEKKTAAAEAVPGATPGEGLHRLLVWRADLPNRRILECYREGTDPRVRGNVVRVRVKDATRYSRLDNTGKPMGVECVWVQADLYEATGRAPLRKGRR